MPIPITITLNSIVGTPGPFDLYSCTGSTCSVTPFVTGVTATGNVITSSDVPNGTTIVKIKSTGAGCDYEISKPIVGLPTNTPTPTPTNTTTPSPTPTPTAEPVNTDLYYYYRLGDCQYMGYEYVSLTNTGFGIIRLSGCTAQDGYDPFENPGNTSYYVDETKPCGFASGYTYTVFGKSLKTNTHIPEGTVFTIDGTCLSVVWIEEQYLPESISLISLDGLTPEPGDNACSTCQPPFTGLTFNWYVYGATRCDNQANILVYSIWPYQYDATPHGLTEFGLPELSSPQTGLTYGMVMFNELGNVVDDGYCATITSYYGAFSGQTVQIPIPGTDPVLYQNLPVGVQANLGYYLSDCDVPCSSLYYYNFTERCDGQISVDNDPIWSTTKLNVNDIIKDDNGDCRKVTIPGKYKEIKYKGYIQSEIISMVGTKYTNNDCSSCS
jgi:hypothetical protein